LSHVAAIAPLVVGAARAAELRVRSSPHARRTARRALAVLARRSREARAYVRLRVMRLA
jgi:hypothetical protein